jgi:hypothetical protein
MKHKKVEKNCRVCTAAINVEDPTQQERSPSISQMKTLETTIGLCRFGFASIIDYAVAFTPTLTLA